MVSRILQTVFFALIVYPVVLIVLGLRIVGKDNLPKKGPAIVVANHNSHLDTLVLMCLFKLRRLHLVKPVAAADYFLKGRFLSYFSQNIVGILPINRKPKGKQNPLTPIYDALVDEKIVIIYPEGSRGEPEEMSSFKRGISHIARQVPDVPIIPVYMHGLGKSLPKNDPILVPFFCDVFIGEPYKCDFSSHDEMIEDLEARVRDLQGLKNAG